MTNPELRRNLWLEITTHRLLAMPIVLALGFLLVVAMDNSAGAENVSVVALSAYVLLTALWGSRLAANSIFDEMVDKTWDWQRLSTLGPWQMTWGKLLGSTAFAWYGGLICLVVFLATASSGKFIAPGRLVLSILLISLGLQAAGIATSLQASRSGEVARRRSIGLLLFIAPLYIAPLVVTKAWGNGETVSWFGVTFDGVNFLLATSAAFAGWCLTGAYRTMCQGLAVRTTPWVWLAFMIFIAIYAGGLQSEASVMGSSGGRMGQVAMAGFITAICFMYGMLFTEPAGAQVLRRLSLKIAKKQWHRALQEMPCWPVSLLFASICGVAAVALIPMETNAWKYYAMSPIPIVLLATRDAGIFLFFSAAPHSKRAAGATLLYVVVFDWMVPAMLGAFGQPLLAVIVFPASSIMTLGQIAAPSAWIAIASALVQAALAGWLAWRRIQVNFSAMRKPDGM